MKEKLFYLFAVMFAVTFGLHSLAGFGTPKEVRSRSFIVVDSNNAARAVISSDAQGGRVGILNAKGDTVLKIGINELNTAYLTFNSKEGLPTLGLGTGLKGEGTIMVFDTNFSMKKPVLEPF